MSLSGSTLKLLGNRNFILLLALSLGLFWGQGVELTEMLVIPALAFVMVLSTIGVDGGLFRTPSRWLNPALVGIFLNYILLGGSIVALSSLLPLKDDFRTGYIILAAVPPAVGVIPFSSILGGDVEFSLIATLACYLGAFLFTPLSFSVFLGQSFDFQQRLFITLTQLILVPLILSRAVRYVNLTRRIEPVRGFLTNWSFFIVVYTIVGVNREVFFSEPLSLLPAAVLTFITTYLLGYIIETVGRSRGVDLQKVTSIQLLGTSKNAGFAAGLALSLFGRQTAIPITVQTVLGLSYIVFLDFGKSRRSNGD